MVQRALVAHRHANQRAARRFRSLADCFRNLARLAVTEANLALLVTNNHEGRKAEPLAALHHLGDAVQRNELVCEFALAIVIPVSRRIACH